MSHWILYDIFMLSSSCVKLILFSEIVLYNSCFERRKVYEENVPKTAILAWNYYVSIGIDSLTNEVMNTFTVYVPLMVLTSQVSCMIN